jgi:hypothetical protein
MLKIGNKHRLENFSKHSSVKTNCLVCRSCSVWNTFWNLVFMIVYARNLASHIQVEGLLHRFTSSCCLYPEYHYTLTVMLLSGDLNALCKPFSVGKCLMWVQKPISLKLFEVVPWKFQATLNTVLRYGTMYSCSLTWRVSPFHTLRRSPL